jgi:hypothetical protein
MAESFLKEQLERIRRLTEQLTAVETNTSELCHAMAHDRAALRYGPLHQVRDYRLYADASHGPHEADDRSESRRSDVRESPRRRRRG